MLHTFVQNDWKGEYNNQFNDLVSWFKTHMAKLEPVSLTPEQYEKGIDLLPEGEMKELVKEAIKVWREERHYELARANQVNPAFFYAARPLGKIFITK